MTVLSAEDLCVQLGGRPVLFGIRLCMADGEILWPVRARDIILVDCRTGGGRLRTRDGKIVAEGPLAEVLDDGLIIARIHGIRVVYGECQRAYHSCCLRNLYLPLKIIGINLRPLGWGATICTQVGW